MKVNIRITLLIIFILFVSFISCGYCENALQTQNDKAQKHSTELNDKPLAAFQKELLATAFKTATSIPLNPHKKDRSRAQMVVVETCIALEQPQTARNFIQSIDDWRRGVGYADLAIYYMKNGDDAQARKYLRDADKVAETDEDWRKERIKTMIAQVYASLGQKQMAANMVQGIDNSELATMDNLSFDEKIKTLDALLKEQNFDLLRGSLESYCILYNIVYDDKTRRDIVEKKIDANINKMPVFLQVQLKMQMAETALRHGDKTTAMKITDEARKLVYSSDWKTLRHSIPLMAKVAELCFLAGDKTKALSDIDATLELFNKKKSTITNIDRAGILITIGQAYRTMGENAKCLAVYKQAVEESVDNPNSRPRAEDICAICCSMAKNGVEPDEKLWDRIRHIIDGLGQPW